LVEVAVGVVAVGVVAVGVVGLGVVVVGTGVVGVGEAVGVGLGVQAANIDAINKTQMPSTNTNLFPFINTPLKLL